MRDADSCGMGNEQPLRVSALALVGQSVEGRDPCPACRASGWCPPCGGPIRMWCCGQHWAFPHHPECNYREPRRRTPRCRFGGHAPAVVLVAMDQGCVCYPDDRQQWLCAQHEHQSEPLGSWEVIGYA